MRPSVMHAFQHFEVRRRVEGRVGNPYFGYTHGHTREAVLADVQEFGVVSHRS
jgi:hypothetical protein